MSGDKGRAISRSSALVRTDHRKDIVFPMVRPIRNGALARRRSVVCAATVVACIPYLALKLAWVAGVPVGVDGTAYLDTTRAANAATLGLQLIAIAVAVVIARPVGQQLPAAVVSLPAWVATGLLAPVGLGVVVGAPVQLATGGGNPFRGDEVLDGWVFAIVYGGFVAQAALLPAGFVLHALARWPGWTRRAPSHRPASATSGLQDLLAAIFLFGGAVFAGQQLWWVVHGGGSFPHPTTSQRTFLAAGALLVLGGAVAHVLVLRGRSLTGSVLVLAWLGTGVAVCSTLMETFKALVIDPEGWGGSGAGPVDASLTLVVLLAGVAGTVGAAFRLVEQIAATGPVRGRGIGVGDEPNALHQSNQPPPFETEGASDVPAAAGAQLLRLP
jgi:hypothetical protein